MGNIKPLSEAVLSAVRSGFIIGDLTTVVDELIHNSLDAGATKVSVYVDVSNGYVKVEDDGSGISRDGLVLLGERYATSRLPHLNDKDEDVRSFGFRGEVLCSIADTSLIEIITKVHGRPNGYRKVMKGHKCLYLSIDDVRQETGTTVIVRDLFYNQPVRRRQMQSSAKKVMHSVKKSAVRIALMQPRVAFKVVDMESEDELLCTHSSSSPLPVLCSNFGIEPSSLHVLSFSQGSVKLEGYVSGLSSCFSLKAIQYIYVNSRYIAKGPIHKVLNHLADMCWEQLSSDERGKRGRTHTGPSYCLNLTCPRALYDLNIEFLNTYVEFKDWAPVLAFIEKSVMTVWSKKPKKENSKAFEADQTGRGGKGKLAENMATVEKDWLMKTCQKPPKRRRIQKTQNELLSTKPSLTPLDMQVEEGSNLSCQGINRQGRNLLRNTAKFGEPAIDVEFAYEMDSSESGDASPSHCIFDVGKITEHCLLEPDKELTLSNEDISENYMTTVQRDDDCGDFLTCPRWEDVLRVDDYDASASNGEAGSGWGHGFGLQNYQLQTLTPFKYNKNPRFPIKNSEANRSCNNSICQTDNYCLSPKFSNFQRSQSQNRVARECPLSKLYIESDMWEEPGITSMKCHDSLPFDGVSLDRERTPDYLSDQVRVLTSCFSRNTDQHSTISYPFLSTEPSDLEHLIQDEAFQRRSFKARKSDAFEQCNDDEGEFYPDSINDTCRYAYKNSFTVHLDTNLSFRNEYEADGKGISGFSPHGHSVDGISAVRYGDLFSEEPHSSCKNKRDRNYGCSSSICWSPSKSINIEAQIDAIRCDAHSRDHTPRERSREAHHRSSPADLFAASTADTLADQIYSPDSDFQCKYSTTEPSLPLVSSVSVDKCPKFDLKGCQTLEPNCSILRPSNRSFKRSKRSYSAPPFYRAKRRIFSIIDYLAESPDVRTGSLVCTVTGRRELEHTPRSPLFNRQHYQQHDISCAHESQFCFEPIVKESSSVMQIGIRSQDDMSETPICSPGDLKPVQDSDSSLIKWREDFSDTRLLDIANYQDVGEGSLQLEYTILDIDSCMLQLAGDSLVPKSINRCCLENAKVLLQVDKKFIPVVAGGTLAVIDQHAADERIRLEELRKKVLSGELNSTTRLEEEKELVLPEMAYQLLCNYAEHVQHWGWMCNIFSQDSSSFNKNLNLLNGQPKHLSLVAVPCILGVNLSDADLLEFLEQLADTDGSSTIPPAILRILNYKACRGAIMFGDKLLPSECNLIVEELRQTSSCFQCAHGRPTTVPLVNLEALHKGMAQLRLWHESSGSSWHGLCRKEINLERARRRLDVARFRG